MKWFQTLLSISTCAATTGHLALLAWAQEYGAEGVHELKIGSNTYYPPSPRHRITFDLNKGGFTMRVDDMAGNDPVRYCSSYHRMPVNSINEGS